VSGTRQRVLITGAAGFVGSHLTRRLFGDGDEVHILVRPGSSTERLEDVRPHITVWPGDLEDVSAIRNCVSQCRPDVVFHLAADTGARGSGADFARVDASLNVNLRATLHLLRELQEAQAPIRTFIRTGGLEEYGCGPVPSSETQRESPVSPYSASQVAATHYCAMLQPYLRFAVVTIRPALIYGPAQSRRFFIPALIEHCLAGRNFPMTTGEQRRELLYIDDAVEVLVRAARTAGLAGEIINAGSGSAPRIIEIAHAVQHAVGSHIQLVAGLLPERAGEIPHLLCNSEKAARLLGWRAETSLPAGLARTVAWYRKRSFAASRQLAADAAD
jgi:UDP-glucose 4-epimerase